MKRLVLLSIMILSVASFVKAEGYKTGEKASDFSLINIDGKYVSLKDYTDAKGFIVVFTCNHCPFAKAYENRLINIHKEYAGKGYPVIAINPNDPEVSPGDSFEEMKKRAKEKNFPYPYLFDEKQEVYKVYGATRTPHIFVLDKKKKDLIVKYIGTIDDNYQDESAVSKKYLTDALDSIIEGKNPNPDFTKAIGCTIKTKKL